MDKQAILHIPMSQYAYGLDDSHMVFRLRTAQNDIVKCTLIYGDRSCRLTPVIYHYAEMYITASDSLFDWWEIILETDIHRVCYAFNLCDAHGNQTYYYGDLFNDELSDDRSAYFQLPFNHRADRIDLPSWMQDAIVYNIFPDSFATGKRFISLQPTERKHNGQITQGKLGGTIRGIIENLDYIKELGFNCIYLNPIFVAGEYHKYDLVDYYHIDPAFGTDEDFRALVQTAHQMGIRVMIDGVFNHCGWHFFAFEDVVKNGRSSRYWKWFYDLKEPVTVPDNMEDYPNYECFGYERMMPKLDTANPEVRQYFCDVGRYWIEEFHIDGWRLDVASEVDDRFWREFRAAVKSADPNALLIGEIWESAGHWLQGDMFDSAMNYDFRKHCRRFFAEGSIDAQAFSGRITDMLMRYRAPMTAAQLNLLDSHDVSRFLSLCNGDERRYRLAVLFEMCFVGMPTIFYGDELGVQGILENDYRAPMPWGNADPALYDFFRSVINLRKSHAALRRGTFRLLSADGMLLVFQRRYKEESITVALNASDHSAPFCCEGTPILSANVTDTTVGPFGYAVYS